MSPLCFVVLSAVALFACTSAAPKSAAVGLKSRTSSFNVIDVIVVVDTAALYAFYQHKSPSKNHLSPTPITHDYSYMVASYAYVVDHQASPDLHLKAKVGDTLRFTGMSESANFDHGVIVYNITTFAGDKVHSSVQPMIFEKDSVRPVENKFPQVQFPDKVFGPIQLSVSRKGKSQYKVHFAMYSRAQGGTNEGNGNQTLFGYFEWDPTLTVPV